MIKMSNPATIPFKSSLCGKFSRSLKESAPMTAHGHAAKALDGTREGMQDFLRELADMVGHDGERSNTPVLELQFERVATVTSLTDQENAAFLSINALLPRHVEVNISSQSTMLEYSSTSYRCIGEVVWHADDGRYVLNNKIPVQDLPNERSVMDAIIDTAGQASAWCSPLGNERKFLR